MPSWERTGRLSECVHGPAATSRDDGRHTSRCLLSLRLRIQACGRPLDFAALLLGFLAAAPVGARAADETPEAFAHRVYARYAANGPGIPMTGPEAEPYYARSLLDAYAAAASGPDEIGPLDADPICTCQDYDDLKVVSVDSLHVEAASATVTVVFADFCRRGCRLCRHRTAGASPMSRRRAFPASSPR